MPTFSPKQGTPSESSNPVFNYHEPLSVNLETKFEQDEILIRNLSNRIQPLDAADHETHCRSSSSSFTDHMTTCSSSLAKLVDLMSQKKPAESCHETDRSFEAMPSDRSLVSAFVDPFTDSETKKKSVNRQEQERQQLACESNENQILNQTFLAYPSEPPCGFRDDSSNLITNQNIIRINTNEISCGSSSSGSSSRAFLSDCMLVETSSYSSNEEETATTASCYEHGSRIAELKKKLGIESEFFFTNRIDQPTGNRVNV